MICLYRHNGYTTLTNKKGGPYLNPILHIENIVFQNQIHYPTIDILKGQMVFLCGESGCGKSTLLKILNATVDADCGNILYQNQPLHNP